jgi:hypothetical protein
LLGIWASSCSSIIFEGVIQKRVYGNIVKIPRGQIRPIRWVRLQGNNKTGWFPSETGGQLEHKLRAIEGRQFRLNKRAILPLTIIGKRFLIQPPLTPNPQPHAINSLSIPSHTVSKVLNFDD